MDLLTSGQLGLTSNMTRGLAYNAPAYAARVDQFVIGDYAIFVLGVPVKAGEETPVPVQVSQLPANADVRKITAKLEILADGTSKQTSGVSVKEGSGPERSFQIGVDTGPGLRNVQVRLQGGQVIWSHGGAAPAGTYEIPDFSMQANAYLEKARITGPTLLQFLVKSDTAGSVQITVGPDLTFALLQTQSWKNDLDSTFRVDRNLPLEFNSVEVLPLDAIAGASTVVRAAIRLDAEGHFGPERLLGEVETYDGRESSTISPDYSVAQQIELNPDLVKKSVSSTGVSIYVESPAAAELYVELQADAGGAPAASAPLAKSNVSYKPPEKGSSQQWTLAAFEKPAQLNLGVLYWVVVKAVRGNARLGLRLQGATRSAVLRHMAVVNHGGDRWKCLAPLAGAAAGVCDSSVGALVSLIYLPEPDNQTGAIQITVEGSAVEQRFDAGGKVKSVALDMSGDKRTQATLLVRSRARGMLTLANVVQEYTTA